MDFGRGGARRCSRVLVVDRERERAEGIGTEGEIRESERVRGAAWRLQGVVGASREAGGGRSREEVAGARGRARRARARPPGRGGRLQGRRWWAGPARGGELGRLVAPGKLGFFLSFFLFTVLFYFFIFLQFVFDLF